MRGAADGVKEGEDRDQQIQKTSVSAFLFVSPLSVTRATFSVEEIGNLTEGQKKDAKDSPNGSASTANGNGSAVDADVEMQDSSDLSDCGPDSGATSEAGSAAGSSAKRSTPRGQSLRRKAQAKSREISRSNAASARRAAADLRKFEEEVNKCDRRLEAIEREFRKLLGCIRVKPMGKDRFHNRIWWFDGLGSGTLVASGGGVVWGTGRVFIQGPSELDRDLLDKRQAEDGDVKKRRLEEEGEEGILGVNEWAAYSDPEQVEELVAWLNTKGIRENALKNSVAKWMAHITHGIRKRQTVSS
jgi:bromodomain adjacent to zinc finger domain protein 1A